MHTPTHAAQRIRPKPQAITRPLTVSKYPRRRRPQGRTEIQNQIVRIDSAVETSTVEAATRFAEL